MKKLLPVLVLFLLAFAGCKKDKTAKPVTDTVATPGIPTNPPVQSGQLAITDVAPASGLPNTVVTITGSGFGSSVSDIIVLFNGVKGTVQSVKPTEIKVLVPVTTTGYLAVLAGSKSVTAGNFTYIFPELTSPYVSGDVTLHSQAEVDAFVALNKGRQLAINGNLNLGAANLVSTQANDITSLAGLSLISSISGQLFCYKINLADAPFFQTLTSVGGIALYSSSFTKLNFQQLHAFSGAFGLSGMPELSQVQLDLAPAAGYISIGTCPKLSDFSFLSGINTANAIYLSGTGAISLNLDKLTSLTTSLNVSANSGLSSLSCAALTSAASVTLSGNPKLIAIKFSSLKSVSGKLSLASIGVTNLNGFGAVESLGALQVYNNPSLVSLQGLEKLTSLTMTGVVTNSILGTTPLTRVNGIYIGSNAKLVSLSGLQNVTTLPIAYITTNPLLTDLCPFKKPIVALSTAAGFTYTYRDQIDEYRNATVAALTMTSNGSYATTADALAAVAQCR